MAPEYEDIKKAHIAVDKLCNTDEYKGKPYAAWKAVHGFKSKEEKEKEDNQINERLLKEDKKIYIIRMLRGIMGDANVLSHYTEKETSKKLSGLINEILNLIEETEKI